MLAAVNGPAVGIGCSLALACDLVVARESAYFLLAFVNIGLIPDGGSSLLVPARVGFARAAEMALLGERVPAHQALEWGLINRVLPDDGFEAEVDALAERLATGPTASYAGTKQELNSWLFERMDDQLELEATLQQEAAALGRLRGGRPGVPGAPRTALSGALSGCGQGRSATMSGCALAPGPPIDCAARGSPRWKTPVPTRARLRRRGRLGRAADGRPARLSGAVLPRVGRLAERRRHQDLYILVFCLALVIFIGVEGVIIYSLIKYRARAGASRRRSTATRAWRSAGPSAPR